ncbi:MAG: 7TM diverse intracellular signaling domain-containing protein [Oligoflexus sp.]
MALFKFFSLACLSFLLASATTAMSQATPVPYKISSKMQGDPLGLHLLTYEDPENTLEISHIVQIYENGKMQASSEPVPNYALNPAAQWVRFQLENPLEQAVEIYLENKFSFIDTFSIYWQDEDGLWQSKTAGDQVPFVNRDILTRQVVYRLTLNPGIHTFYAKSKTAGTMQLPLHIWTADEFYSFNAKEYAFLGILIGFHVVICLYNLFLFISLRDVTYLSYVSYVLSNLLYQCSGLGLIQQFASTLEISQTISNKLMIVAVDFCAITSLLFSRQFLNIQTRLPWMHKIFNVGIAVSLVNIAITTFYSIELGTIICLYTAAQATSLLILCGILVTKSGYPPAKYYLFAWMCYLVGVTGTVSNLVGLMPTSLFTRWGQFTGGAFEVAILSLALGARINEKRRQHVEQINELNLGLEKKVEERTAEVKSLLQHIPQGILSIGASGLLEDNYSYQLIEILGHNNIAHRPFKELIFDCSNLDEDQKDQAYQTLMSSLGESIMNFEVNESKLPKQLTYTFKNEAKVLRLTWNVELDREENVKHILVTMLDISSEVSAQQELQRKNEEFQIIRQLVEVNAKKSIQFFKSCDQLMEENQRLIESGDLTHDSVKILFVNSHTIKGAARSLQLKPMANAFHKVESYYAKILKNRIAIDSQIIIDDFEEVQNCYQNYKIVNQDLLGRRDDHSQVSIDRQFLHENVVLLEHLVDFNEIPQDLKSIIHKNLNELTRKIFSSLQHIIVDTLSQTEKIAADLGKESPEIDYDIDDILINHQQEEAIKNSFIHLLRNSLDHGIETAEERLSKGKKSCGKIMIRAIKEGQEIAISLEDDGAGLDIKKVRERCQKLGFSSHQQSVEKTVAMIFEPGFSTAEKVSLISGRGIGMGAVRQYIEAVGGRVNLELHDALDREQTSFRFRVLVYLPMEPGRELVRAS